MPTSPPAEAPPRRYRTLLSGLVALLVGAPLLDFLGVSTAVTHLVIVVVLVTAAKDLGATGARRFVWIFAALPVVAQALRAASVAAAPWQQALVDLSAFAFLAYVGARVLADVLGRSEVARDDLVGAACGYLLIGVVYAQIYLAIEWVQPGAFAVVASPGVPLRSDVSLANYFSFVTLSTVGFGDVLPQTRLARTLVWTEAVTGQLFMTIAVARLVSLHLAQRADDAK